MSKGELLRRLVPVLGASSVPLVGVLFADWSSGTALTLYWCENLLGALFVIALLLLHRSLTGKRGYGRLQLSLASDPTVSGPRPPRRRRRSDRDERKPKRRGYNPHDATAGSFIAELAVGALAGSLLHGLLLWLVLRFSPTAAPDPAELGQGLVAVAGFVLFGFALDAHRLRERSFAWARERARATYSRVMLVHLAMLAGFWIWLERGGSTFFAPFAALKTAVDVGALLARFGLRMDGPESPRWLTATMHRISPGKDFAEHWRRRRARERRLEADDELVDRDDAASATGSAAG